MRAIIILLVIALLMGLAGWITFGKTPGRATINIETEEIQRDTKNAVENTERVLESGVRAITGQNEVDRLVAEPIAVDSTHDQPVPIDSEPVTTAPAETPVTAPVTP